MTGSDSTMSVGSSSSGATPRPWAMNWAGTDYWVECADNGVNVATMDQQYTDGEASLEETKANAALIVEAVNAYDAHRGFVKSVDHALQLLRDNYAVEAETQLEASLEHLAKLLDRQRTAEPDSEAVSDVSGLSNDFLNRRFMERK